ncbi:MAG: hypothetical protein ACQ5SW_09595 [Sphaerochaetaceae bacterium]
MKIAYLGSNRSACDLYRASLPFKYSENECGMVNKEVKNIINTETNEVVGTNIEADVLIVPRPVSEVQYKVAQGALADGMTLVVEIDDMLDAVHQRNAAYRQSKAGVRWMLKTMELAHLITASTPTLANRYFPEKSLVVENYILDVFFDFEPSDEKEGIGWTGSIDVHPDDLDVTGDALRKMKKRHGWEFKHIGKGNLAPVLKMDYTSYGKLGFDQYMLGIDRFAVGIVPLANNEFNNGKSWLKGIEYASMGVPFVASGTAAEYRRLQEVHQMGTLVYDSYGWYTELRRLCTDESLRNEQSERYRQTAYENLRISQNAWKWDEAWEYAVQRRNNG